MKELSTTFNNLLRDKRVRSDQSKYEIKTRQRATVMKTYQRAYQEFLELVDGLSAAERYYGELNTEVNSLSQNVSTFVNNRRAEGSQLLSRIEDGDRVQGLVDRMTIQQSPIPGPPPVAIRPPHQLYSTSTKDQSLSPSPQPQHQRQPQRHSPSYINERPYAPEDQSGKESRSFVPQGNVSQASQQDMDRFNHEYHDPLRNQQHIPPGYNIPPPPLGPPPLIAQQTFPRHALPQSHPGHNGEAQALSGNATKAGGSQDVDPWESLSAWK
jgi:hypothetical protein